MRRTILSILILAGLLRPVSALVIDTDGAISYQTTEPTNLDVDGWNSGWGSNTVTGWNYVGQINGTSGVYLGDNWVLTAAHVGSGPFILDGVTYAPVPKSEKPIIDSHGIADLIMFRIATAPALPPLTISNSPPEVDDSLVVMIGYGGSHGKTWGKNTVSMTYVGVRAAGGAYRTLDFQVPYTGTAKPRLVPGDSGGGDFIRNSFGQWELAGINEAIDPANDSCMVQLSSYADQIDHIRYGYRHIILKWTLIGLACVVALFVAWKLKARRRRYYR